MLVSLAGISSASAQTYQVLYTFKGRADGANPSGGVIRNAKGALYGTTFLGGSFRYGVIFRISPGGKETVLHNFIGADGLGPDSSLVWDSFTNLYGTTWMGGTPEGGNCEHGCGAVYRRDKYGKVTVLHGFNGKDGAEPLGRGKLARDSSGNLYGTTQMGGTYNAGTVFKVDSAGNETMLHNFKGDTEGANPSGGVILDRQGNLYGTTQYGGPSCCGTLFKIDKNGKKTVLHNFTGPPDGKLPSSWLIRDSDGNLYGTAPWGGNSGCIYGCGIVFKIDPTGTETVLHTFTGAPDGQWPYAGLVRDAAGNLYGVTESGGIAGGCLEGCGTVFKIDVNGNESVLYAFSGGSDGNVPNGLILGSDGNLYGTTNGGGDPTYCGYNYKGCGVVFKITLSGSQLR